MVTAHLLAMGAIALIALPWAYQGALLAMVAFSFYRATQANNHAQWRCDPDGQLLISNKGSWEMVDVLPDSTVLAWLVVLRYRLPGKRFADTCLILADSMPDDDFRRLRVWLRWRAMTLTATSRSGSGRMTAHKAFSD